jgi:hypothetical protein
MSEPLCRLGTSMIRPRLLRPRTFRSIQYEPVRERVILAYLGRRSLKR